jgi:hypothetical protein
MEKFEIWAAYPEGYVVASESVVIRDSLEDLLITVKAMMAHGACSVGIEVLPSADDQEKRPDTWSRLIERAINVH